MCPAALKVALAGAVKRGMPAAPVPPHEIRRLAAVQRTRLLGTPAEERFDKISRLACRLFGVKMSIINIVGEKMTWLKSVQGFDNFSVPRALSYCHYTVLKDEVCIITDARKDPRVSDNPFAASFVFYAGVPLKFEGENVGVMCIADGEPRTMIEDELDALRDLASLAEQELEVSALSESQAKLAASNVELEMKARVDVLTRIWNRGAIHEIAERELEDGRALATSTAIAILDLDHFKQVNDTHGHAAGDEVLRVVSQRLRATIRPIDAVGRYGGEEFLVVLPRIARESVVQVCERIRYEIAKELVVSGGVTIPITCSVGAVLVEDDGESVEALVRAADGALYEAKRAGRDRVLTALDVVRMFNAA